MRIRKLWFDAFGPFTDVVLDLDAGGPAIHVVHGHNEAGKSTALRGLIGLLYGIEERTRDAHLHPMSKLRIRALIERADGSVLEVARRKGRKNTLLDAEGDAIDEAVLRAALGGVGRELFETVFGLHHDSLRTGANALLEGHGDVGESLFDAGVGGRGIHRVLAQLEKSADELFAPRGTTRALNQAIASFKEAKRAVAQAGLSSSAWQEQHEGIAAQRALCVELDRRLGGLMDEQRRLERDRLAIPALDKRAAAIAQREELGALPRLAEDASERRVDAQRTLEATTQTIARLEREIAKLRERRSHLDIPEALEPLSKEAVEELASRLAQHRKAEQDRPKREAELRAAEADATRILRQLGRAPSLDEVDALRLGPDRLARIRALAAKHGRVETGVEEARERLAELRVRLADARAKLEALGEPPDVTMLSAALDRARRLGDVDEQIRAAEDDASRAREAARRAAVALGTDADPATIAELILPAPEVIGALVSRRDEIGRERARLEARRVDVRTRRDGRRRELDLLEATGSVPTETQLAGARKDRDAIWTRIRGGEDAAGPSGDAFERAVAGTDDIADRLRREAERVTRHASLTADLRHADRELAEIEESLESLDGRAATLEAEWARVAAACAPLRAPAIDRIEPFLARATEARRLAQEALDRSTTARALHHRAQTHARQLGDGGEVDADVPLTERVDRAAAIVERAQAHAAEHRAVRSTVEELEVEVQSLERRLGTREEALTEWKRAWGESVACIGLSADATVEEAGELLAALSDLYVKADAARDRQRRLDAMQRDADRLMHDAEALLARYLPEARDGSLSERIDQLVDRHRTMRSHLEKRAEIDHDLAEKHDELERTQHDHREAADRLEQLVRQAGVTDVTALVEVEARVERARELERTIRETEQQLLEIGEGASIEALIDETRGVGIVDVRKRLQLIEGDIEDVQEELRAASRDLWGKEQGVEGLRKRSASDAAAEAQACLAEIRDLTHRYARARLAAAFLRREIERYREKNQGPILTRAAALFPKLTLGSFEGLRAGFGDGDQPVLQCIRADGTDLDVDALSTATRDQLYLALRLATLEHHAAHDEPLPFVLDDVLVEFDDDRARAALAALGDLARVTQVILFTHHPRIVELAREAISDDRRHEHDLDALRSRHAEALRA